MTIQEISRSVTPPASVMFKGVGMEEAEEEEEARLSFTRNKRLTFRHLFYKLTRLEKPKGPKVRFGQVRKPAQVLLCLLRAALRDIEIGGHLSRALSIQKAAEQT